MVNTLRVRRAERRVTQLKLAQACGISQSQISLIENGDAEPKPEEIRKMAKFLRVPASVLFPELASTAVSPMSDAPVAHV